MISHELISLPFSLYIQHEICEILLRDVNILTGGYFHCSHRQPVSFYPFMQLCLTSGRKFDKAMENSFVIISTVCMEINVSGGFSSVTNI